MGTWILDSKLLPPAAPAPWPRPLPAALVGASAAVVAIEAGPGAGKTLALLGLVRAWEATGARTLWLTLDELDAEPATLFAYLLAGLRGLAPAAGAGLEGALAAGADPRLLWRLFFQEAAALGGLSLALDDAHLAGDLAGLAGELPRLPAGVRVAAASRGRLGWPIQQLALAGAGLALDAAALRFTPEEAEALLSARVGGPIPAGWRDAITRLEGWPLGLALLAAAPVPVAVGAPQAALPAEAQLGAYLAEALYAPLDPPQRRFLCGLALFDGFDAGLAETGLAEPDAAARLDALLASHAVTLLADRRTYRIAAPFRAWLRVEADRLLGASVIRNFHGRAAFHLGGGTQALTHFLGAGMWLEAAAVAHDVFQAHAVAGRWQQVELLAAAFPAPYDGLAARWKGELAAHRGDVPAARAAYARARNVSKSTGVDDGPDPEDVAAAYAAELELLASLADRDPYNRLVGEALAHEPAGRPADRARLALARATAAEGRDDVDMRKETYEAVLSLPADPDPALAGYRTRALLGLARVATEFGDLRAASRFLARAAETAPTTGLAAAVAHARAAQALTEGDPDGAASVLAARPAGWEAAVGAVEAIAAERLALAGAPPAEALKALDGLLARAEATGDRHAIAATRLAWAEAALAAGLPARVPPLVTGDPARWTHDDRALAIVAARAEQPAAAQARLKALAPLLARSEERLLEARAAQAAGDLPTLQRLVAAHGYEFLLPPAAPASVGTSAAASPAPSAPPLSAQTPHRGLQVRALGAFDVTVDGEPRTAWPRKKAKVLLAALLLEPAGRKAFELAELLGEGDPAAGAEIYKVNVRALRQTLEPARGKGDDGRFFAPTGGGYALVAAELAAFDLRDFDAAIDAATRDATRDPAAAAEAAERALALYAGDLFGDDRAGDYFETEREAYRAKAKHVAAWLAGHRAKAQDVAGQTQALERAWAIAPTDEDALFTLGEHLVATGQKARLEPLWWGYVKALKSKLGMAPDPDLEHDWQSLARG